MKNNKKGFTLVELMAVIVILALLVGIAVPSAIAISNRVKVKMYNSKVDMILKAAELYGQDNPEKVNSDESSCIQLVTVQDLVNDGKLKKDAGNDVQNPIDNSSLNSYSICIYKKYNRVYAKASSSDCNNWNKNNVLNAELKEKTGCH